MPRPANVAFVLLGLIWGSNFLFMKWAAATITAGQITLLRVLLGFLPVLAYAIARHALSSSHARHTHHFLVMSLLATSVYYFAFAAGTSLLPSGIAGALSGAIPLFTFLAAAVFLRSERVTPQRLLGVLIGFAGVLTFARPWESTAGVDPIGVLWMLLGAASVGVSFVYAKKFVSPLGIAPAALTTYQIGLALLTLPLVTDLDGITQLADDRRALLGVVVGLGLLGTGLAYLLYYFIVEHLGAVTASSATYIPPVVALAIGWLLVDEPVHALDGAAVLLILLGVTVLRLAQQQPGPAPAQAAMARLSR